MPPGGHVAVPAPDHVIHPIDRTSKNAGVLRRVAQEFHKDSVDFFKAEDLPKGMDGALEKSMRPTAERAKDFALNLREYWKSSVSSFMDRYTYEARADPMRLQEWKQPLGEVGARLEPELKKWEELTSPFADHYDEGAVYTCAHELLDTLRGASEKFQKLEGGMGGGPQGQPDLALSVRLRSAVSGVSEQIGRRLAALGAGEVVPLVTASAQTREAMDRARQDPTPQKLADRMASAVQFRDDFRTKFTENGLLKLREKLIDITEKSTDKSLSKDAQDALQSAKKEITESLHEFTLARLKGMDKAVVPGREAKWEALRDVEKELKGDLARILFKMKPADRTALVAQAKAKAAALAKLEKPFIAAASKIAEQAASNLKERVPAYKQNLNDARSRIGKDLSGYWSGVKSDFLDLVETNADPKLKSTLDKAFDAKFADKLGAWQKLVSDPRADLAKVEKLTSEILLTGESCSTRAESILKAEGRDALPLLLALDQLNASLVAIREGVAKRLSNLLS